MRCGVPHSAFMPSFGGSIPVSHAVELGCSDEQEMEEPTKRLKLG